MTLLMDSGTKKQIQSSLMQQLQYFRGEMTKQMLVELDSQAFISLSHSMAKALVI